MNDSIYHHLTEEQLERVQELDEEMYKIEIRLKKIERERRKKRLSVFGIWGDSGSHHLPHRLYKEFWKDEEPRIYFLCKQYIRLFAEWQYITKIIVN